MHYLIVLDYQQPFLLPLREIDEEEGVIFRNSFVAIKPSPLHGLGITLYLLFDCKLMN